MRIVAAEPLPGELVQGLRSLDEGFIPEILDPSLIDAKYLVSNRDAIAALRDLVFREGIFAGPSCGAVLVAAAREAQRMTGGHDRRAAARRRLEVPLRRHVHDRLRRHGGGAGGRRQLVVSDHERVDGIDAKRIVADGYDRIAERYFAWSDERPSAVRLAWLDRALAVIPPGTDVLDLGCGAGVPMTRALARGRRVTGVDLSARQLELARANVPEATFLQADMTALDLPAASLDAVVAFYSLTHVPWPSWRACSRPSTAGFGRAACSSGRWARTTRPTRSRRTGWASRCSSAIRGQAEPGAPSTAGFEVETAVVEEEPEDRHEAQLPVGRRPQAGGAST